MRTIPTLLLAILLLASLPLCGCLGGPGETTPTPSPAATLPITAPLPPPSLGSGVPADRSSNWAGYAVQTSFDSPGSDAVESVEATWNVPEVNCSLSANDDASSFWIGIDGISSESVEQIGTDSDCTGGSPVYYAWYEVYPQDSVTLDIEISPGDEVNARIDYLGNNTFRYTLRDLTTSKTVSVTHRSRVVADRSSAEWIVEAPVDGRVLLPLADFSPVEFRNAAVTINGKSGSISGGGWEHQPILMESRRGSIKATPSELSADGTGFSVVWDHP